MSQACTPMLLVSRLIYEIIIFCKHSNSTLNFFKYIFPQQLSSTHQSKNQLPMLSTNHSQDCSVKVLGQSFKICKKIDEGAFGKIYKAVSLNKSSNQYAVKMESMRAQHPQLIYQCKLYHSLHSDPTACERGIPCVFECGVEDEYNYMVMELMGPSLQNLLNQCGRHFGLKTILLLLEQMISNIQYLHSRYLIHRDIKPDNYCMGAGKSKSQLFLLDFGLAKMYMNRNGKHIVYKQGKSLTGTARYASIKTHIGIQQSRRDDMQSIGYVAIYLFKGFLPWQGQKGGTKQQKYQRIKNTKINTSVQNLCRNIPEQFRKYLHSVKNLKFEEQPDYQKYIQMFRTLFERNGYKNDFIYDWNIANETKTNNPYKYTL